MEDRNQPEVFEVPSPSRLFWLFIAVSIALNYLGREMQFFPWRFLLWFVVVIFCVVIARKATRAGDKVTMVLAWFAALGYSFVVLLVIGLIVLSWI